MLSTATPEARELERRDVCAILARNITGRIAFARNGEIEIRPIRYVYADGSLYLRSAPDTALSEIGPHGTRVGFEVDEIHTTQRWRSVVVRGTLYRILPDQQRDEWLQAFAKLRRFAPVAHPLQDQDAQRTEIFRIDIRDATGRAMG